MQDRKKRILLIPDYMDWVLGTIARQIIDCNKNEYDFFVYPATEMYRHPRSFLKLASRVDIIHCLNPWDFMRVRDICDKAGVIDVGYVYSVHHVSEPEQIDICTHADVVMTGSRLYEDYLRTAGVDERKIEVVNYGVDTDFFRPSAASAAKEYFDIPMNAFSIGFAAKSSSDTDGRKGVDTFFKVIESLSNAVQEDIHVLICGPGWSEALKGIHFDNVKLHYHEFLEASNMPLFYSSLDIYLICSRVEGGPVPLLEAMACGTCVVTTPVGHVSEVVSDQYNGLVFEIDNVNEAFNKILLLKDDGVLKQKISRNARETILQGYRWQHTMQGARRIYERLDQRNMVDLGRNLAKISKKAVRRDAARWRRNNNAIVKKLKSTYRRFMSWAT